MKKIELISQFGLDGEHPQFPCVSWLEAASSGQTRQGYWDWVVGTIAGQLGLQEPSQTVWVVMGNDFPDSVFSTEELANGYVQEMDDTTPTRIRWRAYDFIVDEKVRSKH